MRKIVIAVLLVGLFTVPVFAGEGAGQRRHEPEKKVIIVKKSVTNVTNVSNVTNTTVNENLNKDLEIGAKLDAPRLVELTENLHFGVEGAKDLLNTNFEEGWKVYGKITYSGTWFKLHK